MATFVPLEPNGLQTNPPEKGQEPGTPVRSGTPGITRACFPNSPPGATPQSPGLACPYCAGIGHVPAPGDTPHISAYGKPS